MPSSDFRREDDAIEHGLSLLRYGFYALPDRCNLCGVLEDMGLLLRGGAGRLVVHDGLQEAA